MTALKKEKSEEKKGLKGSGKVVALEKANPVALADGNGMLEQVLIEPWVTEKSTNLNMENKYVFRIMKSADKMVVSRSIESIFKVKPVSIKIINIHPKKRMRGRTFGKKPGYKKAIVRLKDGDKIELFKGV